MKKSNFLHFVVNCYRSLLKVVLFSSTDSDEQLEPNLEII